VETPGGPFTVRDVDIQLPGPGDVLVRTTAVGMCHTDLSLRAVWPAALLPMVFGHEGAGIVETVGDGVTGLAAGDTVCLSFDSCGRCAPCSSGHPAYCVQMQALNTVGTRPDGSTPLSRDGAPVHSRFFGQSSFARHVLSRERNTVKVPGDLPPAVAAPLGCSVQTGAGAVLNVLRPAPSSWVVVFGAGSVGLAAVMGAAVAGCRTIVVDPVAARRDVAGELGAEAALDPRSGQDIAAVIRKMTGGGADCGIDTTGLAAVIDQAVTALRPRADLALVGIGPPAPLDLNAVLSKGIRLRGVIEGDSLPGTFIPELVALYRAGRLPLGKIITEFPFEDIEAAATAALAGQVIKPVLTFG
jgi:aryl-alcohol dehydrogenase